MSDKPGLRPQQAVGHALRDVARHILAEGRTAVEDQEARRGRRGARFPRGDEILARLPAAGRAASSDADERRWRTEARDLARMLAGARDAQAALDAVADAEHHAPSHRLSSQSWDTIRTKLEDLRARRRPQA